MKRLLYILPLLLLYACEEIILEDDISDEEIHLIAPADDAQFTSTGITFTWDPIAYEAQYRIQIARPDFDNPLQIITDNIVDETSFTTQLNFGEYEWRVQGVNSGYQTQFAKRSFVVLNNDDFGNNSVTLSLPSNGTITNSATQQLSWQSVLGASNYNLQVVNIADNTVVLNEDITETSYSYTFPEGNYEWKVRATDGAQYTLFSQRTILVDTTPPNLPTLVTPENLSITADNNVNFKWNRTPIAGSTEKDSIYIYKNNELTLLEYKNEETSPYNTSTLSDGTYYWFIKSFDAAGNTSQQSDIYSFTLN